MTKAVVGEQGVVLSCIYGSAIMVLALLPVSWLYPLRGNGPVPLVRHDQCGNHWARLHSVAHQAGYIAERYAIN